MESVPETTRNPDTRDTTQLRDAEGYVAEGMPPLGRSETEVSYFEFWPMWLMYLPVAIQWLVLAIRNGSLTLPLIANPNIPVAGMVGVGKSKILAQAKGHCADAILPWIRHDKSAEPLRRQVALVLATAADKNIVYPFVCKPDLGCRGSGVKRVSNDAQLHDYLYAYPTGTGIIVQKLARWEPEAGVFYTRMPGAASGKINSLALKYSPYVVGDGNSTLRELIECDSRASQLRHLYHERHKVSLDTVIQRGSKLRLVFSISHCRGAIFRNGAQYITPQLSERINELMLELPEFYYGRLDIKFRDTDSLMRGEDIEIIEINAASSESLHIWDRNATLLDAIRALLWQYRTLFRIGRANRARGFKPPAIREVLRRWKAERRLARFYPMAD